MRPLVREASHSGGAGVTVLARERDGCSACVDPDVSARTGGQPGELAQLFATVAAAVARRRFRTFRGPEKRPLVHGVNRGSISPQMATSVRLARQHASSKTPSFAGLLL